MAAFVLPLVLAAEWFRRPGWAAVDEEAQLRLIQHFLEGAGLSWRYASGSIQRGFSAVILSLGGGLNSMRLGMLGLLLAENVLLYKLTRTWHSHRAARWAVLANLFSSFFLVRGRSLLSFATLPFFLLLFLVWLEHLKKSLPAFLFGLTAALLLVDYEGWSLVLPALTLMTLANTSLSLKIKTRMLLGCFIGTGIVYFISAASLPSHFAVRQTQSLPFNSSQWLGVFKNHLISLFFGGESYPYLGVSNHPGIPVWLLLGLIPGLIVLIRRKPTCLAWLLFGLVPLMLRGQDLMMHRLSGLWPLLCIATGMGFSEIISKAESSNKKNWKRQGVSLLCIFLALGGAGIEWQAMENSMQRFYTRFYSQSENQMDAVAWIQTQISDKPAGVLTDLHSKDTADLRFLLNHHGEAAKLQTNARYAFIPWQYSLELERHKISLKRFQHSLDEAPVYLAVLNHGIDTKTFERLQSINQELQTFHLKHAFSLPLEQAKAAAQKISQVQDPWSKTALWEIQINSLRQAGKLNFKILQQALNSKLIGADLYINESIHLIYRQPQASLKLLNQSLRIDPRRRLAWRLKRQILLQTGQKDLLAGLDRQIQNLKPLENWNPQWLWY